MMNSFCSLVALAIADNNTILEETLGCDAVSKMETESNRSGKAGANFFVPFTDITSNENWSSNNKGAWQNISASYYNINHNN